MKNLYMAYFIAHPRYISQLEKLGLSIYSVLGLATIDSRIKFEGGFM